MGTSRGSCGGVDPGIPLPELQKHALSQPDHGKPFQSTVLMINAHRRIEILFVGASE